ncbi:MAG: hypothetical protein K9W44_11545 [Candidatus Lokiarchaeota archaeon]|nr:hypothetical protein [Candidatus Harpocratesius repetitus]
MSTIKFDHQNELDELIARIYLDTKIKLTKKELLSLIFKIGKENYQTILDALKNREKASNSNIRDEFINSFSGILTVKDPDEINPKEIWNSKELD